MEIILMGLIMSAAIFIVGYPLVNADRFPYAKVMVNGDDPLEGLQSARNSVFDALRDLEFDHDTGKLSEADYRSQRARYEAKAAEILQQLDAATATKAKRSLAAPAGSGVAKTSARSSCRKCGSRLEPGDRFCPKCGQKTS